MSAITLTPFALAALHKDRFASARGPLTVEQLFDLPLRPGGKAPQRAPSRLASRPDFDQNEASLNGVATIISKELEAMQQTDFVGDAAGDGPRRETAERKMSIVKIVIDYRKGLLNAAKKKAEMAEQRRVLQGIIAKKKAEQLEDLSLEDALAQLEALK